MVSTTQRARRVEYGELFIDVGMLDGWRKSIGEGNNSWRGLYPRFRSFIVLRTHPMTNDKSSKVLPDVSEANQ